MPNARNFAVLVCALVLASSTALAENPATWNFTRLTVQNHGTLSWTSPTAVDTHFSQYDYSYNITDLEIYVTFLGMGDWVSAIDEVPADKKSGSGVKYGTPPITIMNEAMGNDYGSATINIYVDSVGYAHVDLTNVEFGSVMGITPSAARVTGSMTVTGTPEPVTIAMMCMGGGLLLKRRRMA